MPNFQQIEDFQFIEEGRGQPIVLLHGLFGSLANYEKTLLHFSKKYRVIVPILPIYSLELKESTVDGMTDYVDRLISALGLKNFTLIGNSLGGHVGLIYALKNPGKMAGLVLTGSSGLFEKAFGDNLPKRSDYEFIKDKTAQTFFDPKVATKALVDEIYDIVNDREKALRVLSIAKSAIRQNLKDSLGQINIPVLLIWGKNDNITPPFVAEEFHKFIPHSELKWIDKCGHAAMMEHPNIFNELLEGFLRSLKQIA